MPLSLRFLVLLHFCQRSEIRWTCEPGNKAIRCIPCCISFSGVCMKHKLDVVMSYLEMLLVRVTFVVRVTLRHLNYLTYVNVSDRSG